MHTWTELNWALTQERPQASKSCIASRCDLHNVFTFTAHCHPLVKASLQRLSCSDVTNLTSLSNGEPTIVCKYFKNCLTVIQTCKLMARRRGRSLVVFGWNLHSFWLGSNHKHYRNKIDTDIKSVSFSTFAGLPKHPTRSNRGKQ